MDIDQEGIEIMFKSTESSASDLRVGTEASHVTLWLEEQFSAHGGFEHFCEVLDLSPGWGRRKWDQVGDPQSDLYVHEVVEIIKDLDLDFVEAMVSIGKAYEDDARIVVG